MKRPFEGGWAKPAGWLGLALLGAYFTARALLPDTGPAEFVYTPFGWYFTLIGGMRGFTVEQVWDHALRIGLLGPALLLLAVALARHRGRFDVERVIELRAHVPAAVLSLATTAYVMLFVLKGRPIVDDETAYATMARILASGRLADPSLPELSPTLFEIATPLGITGKYLPGEPLVQIVGVALGIPALAHIPLCAVTLMAFHRATLLLTTDARVASWSTTFLALSPMFILGSATGHSQATALTCTSLGLLGYALASTRGLARGGALAGGAMAFGLLVRPQEMPVVTVVLGLAFTWLAVRRRAWGAWAAFGLTAPLGIAAIVGYDYALAGRNFQFPFFFMMATEQWGIGPIGGPGSYEHTWRGALLNQLVVAVRLNAWWLGWPLSLLLLTRRTSYRVMWTHARVLLGVALGIVAFQFGYFTSGISDIGPVYHYELLFLLAVCAASFVLELSRTRPRLAGALLLVHLVLGTGTFLVEQTGRLHRLSEGTHGESDRIVASLPPHSLLLTETDCSETIPVGWLLRNFPREVRDEHAEVIIHARPDPANLDALLARLSDRACFYVRTVPNENRREVLPCAEARHLLTRPLFGAGPCYVFPSTAELRRWGTLIGPL